MKDEGLKRGYDGNIQGCRLPTLPIWEIDIYRTALRAGDERRNLFSRCQCSRAGRVEDGIADGIVSQNSVTIPPTPHLVVTKGVSS